LTSINQRHGIIRRRGADETDPADSTDLLRPRCPQRRGVERKIVDAGCYQRLPVVSARNGDASARFSVDADAPIACQTTAIVTLHYSNSLGRRRE